MSAVGDPQGRRDAYNERFPAFDAFEVSGSGDQLVPLGEGRWAGLVHVHVTGGTTFALWESDAHGVPLSTLVNASEYSDGTTAFGLDGLERAAVLNVRSTGDWTLSVSSVRDAPDLSAEGRGDGVFWNTSFDGDYSVEFDGGEVFHVTTYPDYAWVETKSYVIPALDFPDAAAGSRQALPIALASYDSLVVVNATGVWTIS